MTNELNSIPAGKIANHKFYHGIAGKSQARKIASVLQQYQLLGTFNDACTPVAAFIFLHSIWLYKSPVILMQALSKPAYIKTLQKFSNELFRLLKNGYEIEQLEIYETGAYAILKGTEKSGLPFFESCDFGELPEKSAFDMVRFSAEYWKTFLSLFSEQGQKKQYFDEQETI